MRTVLVDQPEALQRALDLIHSWAQAWAAAVSTGRGKTEAMAFVPGSPADTESGGAIPLTCAGTPIHWTEQNRYLGFILRSDLREEEAVKKREHFIEAGFCRTFTHNSSNRSMCEGAKLQMYHVGCLGMANYVGPILPMNPAAL